MFYYFFFNIFFFHFFFGIVIVLYIALCTLCGCTIWYISYMSTNCRFSPSIFIGLQHNSIGDCAHLLPILYVLDGRRVKLPCSVQRDLWNFVQSSVYSHVYLCTQQQQQQQHITYPSIQSKYIHYVRIHKIKKKEKSKYDIGKYWCHYTKKAI